jgi:hypothetical protein
MRSDWRRDVAWTKRQLMDATVIRLMERGPGAGTFYLMNKQSTGWSSSCYPYATLSALLAEWDVELGRHDRDQWSAFIHAYPRKKSEQG